MTPTRSTDCVNNSHSGADRRGIEDSRMWLNSDSSVVYAFGKGFGIRRAMAGGRQLVIVGAVASLSTGAAVLKAQQAAPAAQAPAGQGDQPGVRFRSSVDLVSVAAVVRDRKGRFVSDLSQRDFTVVEGGQPRPIVGFRAEADAPVRLAIVFDVSGSMRVGTKAADAREAARLL